MSRSIPASLLMLLSGAAAAAPGEGASRLVESPLSAGNVLTTMVGLALVLGLMLGLAWLIKRYGQVPGMGKGLVRVLGGVSLGAREKAVLLAVDDKRILVGIAPGQVRTLIVLDAEAQAADDFAAVLNRTGETARTGHGGVR